MPTASLWVCWSRVCSGFYHSQGPLVHLALESFEVLPSASVVRLCVLFTQNPYLGNNSSPSPCHPGKGWPCRLASRHSQADQSEPPFCPSWSVQPWLGQIRPIRGPPWSCWKSRSFSGLPGWMGEMRHCRLWAHLPQMFEGDTR